MSDLEVDLLVIGAGPGKKLMVHASRVPRQLCDGVGCHIVGPEAAEMIQLMTIRSSRA